MSLKSFSEIEAVQGKRLNWEIEPGELLPVRLMAEATEYQGRDTPNKVVGWFVCPILPSGDYDEGKVGTIGFDDLVEEI